MKSSDTVRVLWKKYKINLVEIEIVSCAAPCSFYYRESYVVVVIWTCCVLVSEQGGGDGEVRLFIAGGCAGNRCQPSADTFWCP